MTPREIVAEIGINGALDIAVMTAVLYAAWLALRRSPSLLAVRGAVILGGLYLVARQFNLALTAAALEVFFVVLALAAVVVFREELRRLVERVARLGRQRKASAGGKQGDIVSVLVSTLPELARARVGALVVLVGSESVDSLLDGGTALHGELSQPLLASIFDPSSMGHDGAVVIQDGLVRRFACHLPLSTNFDVLGNLGTRHAAALGMSERCDSLALVVSEERGAISSAYMGELRVLEDRDAVAERITSFVGESARPSRWRELLTRHHAAKLAALGVAMLSWVVLVFGARPARRTFEVPVEATTLATDRSIRSVTPAVVTVTFSGARRDFYFVGSNNIRLTPSLTGRGPGLVSVALSPEQISAPRGLSVTAIDPTHVAVMVVPAGKTPAGP